MYGISIQKVLLMEINTTENIAQRGATMQYRILGL
jgi:hypothetical protein